MSWSADPSAPSPAGRSIENLLADRPRRQTLTAFDPPPSGTVVSRKYGEIESNGRVSTR